MTLDRSIVKKKLKIPKRMYRPGIVYSFTFNFNDEHQGFDENSVRRPHTLIKSINILTKILSTCADYKLYPEFSTPEPASCLSKKRSHSIVGDGYGNRGPRFHFHGLLRFTDIMCFYLAGYYKLLKYGLFEIDTINDHKVWRDYCLKDKELMEPFMRSYKVVYPIQGSNAVGDII